MSAMTKQLCPFPPTFYLASSPNLHSPRSSADQQLFFVIHPILPLSIGLNRCWRTLFQFRSQALAGGQQKKPAAFGPVQKLIAASRRPLLCLIQTTTRRRRLLLGSAVGGPRGKQQQRKGKVAGWPGKT
jgi:hypothetical protein